MKKVLITGANSYIGTSFEKWVQEQHPNEFQIDTIDMIGESWREKNFEGYDAVFHVAGIAHADVGKVSKETKRFYYKVNRDLAIETAKKAKQDGVNQFVLMSSMIIYGESAGLGKKKVINKMTEPQPANFYGDSKWQADKGVRKLESKEFHVAVVRPPMIYGKGSKGNYPLLSKFAKKLPIFPDIQNERSMLHIDNLCEFLSLLMLSGEGGIYFPQNKEYVQTSKMVKEIAMVSNHKIKIARLFNPFVWIASKIPGKISGLVNKAFGNMVYENNMSTCFDGRYQIRSLNESIKITEKNKKKVLILVNHEVVIYNFRKELVAKLLEEGYEVIISSPKGERIDILCEMGCKHVDVELNRHGTNPLEELKLILYYRKLIADVRPNVILTYTIKPNLYGAIVAALYNIPIIVNITGLGTAVENPSNLQRFMILMYRIAFRKVQTIFVQNTENRDFFIKNRIGIKKLKLLPGSGVNLNQFQVLEYPKDEKIQFVFISRIMKEKGIDQYLEMAKYIKRKYPNTYFHICGFCEEEYESVLNKLEKEGIIIYHGLVMDIREILAFTHCTIHPTYYPEGMSNVLLESAASGRPIITTNRSGCREIVENEVNGYRIPEKNAKALIEAVEKFLNLPNEEKKIMGLEGRKKVEKEFDREIVISAYMGEIKYGL